MRHFIFTTSVLLFSSHAMAFAAPKESSDFTEKSAVVFLKQHCARCHGSREQKADFRVDTLKSDAITKTDAEAWNHIRYKLVSREMPPDDQPQPDRGQAQRFSDWIARQLSSVDIPLLEPDGFYLPKFGNHVDHQALFDGTSKGPAYTESRLWRMGPNVYDRLVKSELAKNAKGIAQPFSELSDPGFKDYAAAFSIDEPTTDQLIRNANTIVENQTRGELKDGRWQARGYPKPVKEFVALFDPKNQPPSDSTKRTAIQKQFSLILKRAPTSDEESRYLKFLDENIKDAGLLAGVRTTLTAVLLTPEAVFRMEMGTGSPDEHGRRFLAPRELAYAISFALTDRRPDGDLIRAAAEGRLNSPEDVRREVDRIWDTEKIQKPRIMRFFHEYFGFRHAREVFKDKKLNVEHQPAILISDTEQLIEWILRRDRDVLRELLTTRKSFVNYDYDSKRKKASPKHKKFLVHTSYGLPADWKWQADQPIDLPDDQRAGILTQPAWLVAYSGNFDNHPIQRGKWIRERLLGGMIPDLPITVDAQLPDEPQHTLRHRMRVTREEYCWNCHRRMNPLGLPFEMFDHFGRYRSTEPVLDLVATDKNVDKKGRVLGDVFQQIPVDASGAISMTGDKRIDRDYNNAVAMLEQLADSELVRQVFIRHVFRYFMGRNEQLRDSPTLIAADEAYLKSQGSFRALVISLLTSDSFLYRKDNRPHGNTEQSTGSPKQTE